MDYGEIDSENTAIKRIKRMIMDGVISQEDAEKYCPELIESEDERIRKALVKYFTSRITNLDYEIYSVPFKEVLAWLEKMKSNPYTGVGFKYNGQTYGMCARDGGIDILVDSKLISHIDIRQGELEIKLKIEKGKWYICISQFCNCIEGRVYKAISDNRIMDDFGTEYDMHSDAYKYFRLWTIQDAKDGDVLANDHHIFILRELGYSWAADKNPDSLYAYCGITNGNFELEQKGYCFCGPLHTYPATKEQRDILFQKMKEAGYEWDAEKKVLKKIEQKSTEWSEEDEYCIKQLIVFCENCMVPDSGAKRCANWLKFLKDRYTWKPSDEQMNLLEELVKDNNQRHFYTILRSLYEQLKKLREE